MKQIITDIFRNLTHILYDSHNQSTLAISSFSILFACLLLLAFGRSSHNPTLATTEVVTSTPLSVTSTKWWIRVTPTPSHSITSIPLLTDTTKLPPPSCAPNFSSHLQIGAYAYISLTPFLPNRLRAGAGKAYAYLGQIQPGDGLRILDGPLCADGFAWWYVETFNRAFKGWTMEGRASELWIIPCPDQTIPCSKKPAPTLSTSNTFLTATQTEDKQKNSCRSDKLAVGMLAQVEQDSLLILRLAPNSNTVIGRMGPLSVINVVDGPACTGSTVWWQVKSTALNISGWATENNLHACSKEDQCT